MKRKSPTDLISLREAAEILGKSKVTVWRWVRAGRLPSIVIADRLFVRRGDVRRIAHAP